MSYQIITLGTFNVLKNQTSLLNSSSNSKKIWELYKFMFSHRSQSFTAEMLTDQLWSDAEYQDASATIRRQMHRLRKLLLEDLESGCVQSILLSNGFYRWNPEVEVQIDADEFIQLSQEAEVLRSLNATEALETYRKALRLYSGDYLSESIEEHWVFPRRNYLRQLFLKSVISINELLSAKEEYEEIISHCEKAIKIDIYEEVFHLQLVQAYINIGNYRSALDHIDRISQFLRKEMGIDLSQELLTLRKQLLSKQFNNGNGNNDLTSIIDFDKSLKDVFYCEKEVFRGIYELEFRRAHRDQTQFSVYTLSLNLQPNESLSKRNLYNKKIQQQIRSSFRKGDVYTQWDDDQYLLLLSGVDDQAALPILHRVFQSDITKKTLSLEPLTLHQTMHQ